MTAKLDSKGCFRPLKISIKATVGTTRLDGSANDDGVECSVSTLSMKTKDTITEELLVKANAVLLVHVHKEEQTLKHAISGI